MDKFDDVDDLPVDDEPEAYLDEQDGDESEGDEDGEEEQSADDDDASTFTVQIGDDEPEPEDPPLVRKLRGVIKEKEKENNILRSKIKGESGGDPLIDDPGPEPTLEDADYDEAEFKRRWKDWNVKNAKAEVARQEQAERERQEQEAWDAKLESYGQAKHALKVPDYDDAEAIFLATFSVTQQGIAIQAAKDPAVLVYALGKNPKRVKELAAISNPIAFAVAVRDMEASLKVSKRGAPPPEKRLQGGTPGGGNHEATLERLRAKAEKTGDFSEVIKYKRQMQAAKS